MDRRVAGGGRPTRFAAEDFSVRANRHIRRNPLDRTDSGIPDYGRGAGEGQRGEIGVKPDCLIPIRGRRACVVKVPRADIHTQGPSRVGTDHRLSLHAAAHLGDAAIDGKEINAGGKVWLDHIHTVRARDGAADVIATGVPDIKHIIRPHAAPEWRISSAGSEAHATGLGGVALAHRVSSVGICRVNATRNNASAVGGVEAAEGLGPGAGIDHINAAKIARLGAPVDGHTARPPEVEKTIGVNADLRYGAGTNLSRRDNVMVRAWPQREAMYALG